VIKKRRVVSSLIQRMLGEDDTTEGQKKKEFQAGPGGRGDYPTRKKCFLRNVPLSKGKKVRQPRGKNKHQS